ncbi:spore cortex biosynthesis protein YabQ [Rummeliibacillus sp. NPDC094406]|uniref:spore cortex biosynthesis protein YabQ n=1 Tax=Rummeliibacillus sp. NPDC094406 TaxID=3364511 RepID=UPI003824443C
MTVSEQFLSITVLITSGVIGAACIDLVRTLSHYAPPKSLRRKGYIIFELSTWILLGISTFSLLMIVRDGEWHFVDFLSQLLGFCLYQLFLQRFFRFIGRLVDTLVIRPIGFILHLFVSLIRQIIRLLFAIYRIITYPIFIVTKKVKKLTLKK